MSSQESIQVQLNRLEHLKRYQAYYGPNTPLPVITEIRQIEADLQRQMGAKQTRPNRPVRKKVKKKKKNQKKRIAFWQVWKLSQATIDAIATIAFIGLVFLLGSIVFAAYIKTRPSNAATIYVDSMAGPSPTMRPTFTATYDPNAPQPQAVSYLPTPGRGASPTATLVPSLTPSVIPTATLPPTPTETPIPTATVPPPPPAPTATPGPPTPTPAPSYPFQMVEQGNREFQHTNYHAIVVYVAVVSEGNIPMGGYKLVGDHVPTGAHIESPPSAWDWNAVNCLDCDYVKSGNLKLELGPFVEGVWNVYLVDGGGTQVSPVVSLPYSPDPSQWVWDFLIFRRSG